MTNLFDYFTWRSDLEFKDSGFNEVDGLIFSALAYLPFELIPNICKKPIKIETAAKKLLKIPDIADKTFLKQDAVLLEQMKNNKRFGELELYDFQNIVDAENQIQFSAITVRLNENTCCIAFRGTDNTLVGWKEDFNMSFVCPVPSQKLAVEYLEKEASEYEGNFIVCGHSKGGNLSIYSAAFCAPSLQSRIERIYNYDGPGFDGKILQTNGYKNISDKISTFVPQSSIVGMLMEHEETYTVIHSSQNVGFLQHDFYSWDVIRNHFVYLDAVTNSSKFIDSTLKGWLSDMEYQKREQFIDILYTVLMQTESQTIKDLSGNWFKNAKTILKSIHNLDEDTQKAVNKAIRSLMQCAKKNMALINPIEIKKISLNISEKK